MPGSDRPELVMLELVGILAGSSVAAVCLALIASWVGLV